MVSAVAEARSRARRVLVATSAAIVMVVGACGGTSETTTTATPTTEPASVPEIVVSPEFVNGAIPGSRLVLLVGLAEEGPGPVTVTAEARAADVTVEPSTIGGSEVAEVTVIPAATDTESDIEVTITAERGGVTRTVTRTVTVVPWEDDRGDQARAILGLFDDWLAENHPEFGITPQTEFAGTFTAPLLLIVSHYGFYSDAWEVGVSWHIMVPPDDFAELYLRPRDELAPTHAYRIESWQTAIETGEYEVTEIAPPSEVVR
jgi:hypothetical protein